MGKHNKVSQVAKKWAGVIAGIAMPATLFGAGTAEAAEFDADAIASCESGGKNIYNYMYETDPNYYSASGYFQIVNSTWRAHGGTEFAPTAIQASYAQQLVVAKRIFNASGYSPWSSSKGCWSKKLGQVSLNIDAKTETFKVPEAPKTQGKHRKAEETSQRPVETYQALPAVTPQGQYTPGGTGTYTVVQGDTLSTLAVNLGVTVNELFEMNRDVIEHKDWIYVGEKLQTS